MKKFISALLALAMMFSICGISAFAEDITATATAVVNTATQDGVVSDAENIKVGDTFEVVVKIKDIVGTSSFQRAQVVIGWNKDVVDVVTNKGVAPSRPAQGFTKGKDVPVMDDYGDSLFNWDKVEMGDNYYNISVFIMNENSEFFESGYPIENGEVEFVKIRFKAKAAGKADIKVISADPNGVPTDIYLGVPAARANVSFAPVDIVVKSNEPGPTEPTVKTLTEITKPSITETYTVGDTFVPFPAKAAAKIGTEDIQLDLMWTPETVSTAATGNTVVKATAKLPTNTAEVEYKFADGLTTEFTYTVVVNDVPHVEPEVKNVTHIEFPEIKTSYTEGDEFVAFPAQADVTVDGKVEKMNITWEPDMIDTSVVAETSVTATVQIPAETTEVIYELAEGVEKTKAYTVTVAAADNPPVVEDKFIESVEMPADINVFVGEEVTLPETVVGHVADGTTVDVPVKWNGSVNTKNPVKKTVKGTLTAPEGYKLAGDLKTVSVNVTVEKKPAVPIVEALPELENLLPKTLYVGDEYVLPTSVKATVDGKDVELPLIWDPDTLDTSVEDTKVLTVRVDTTGYEVAKDVVTEATISVEVIPVPELPVAPEVTFVENQTGGVSLNVKVNLANEEFINNLPVAPSAEEVVYIAYTFMDGATPIEGNKTYLGVTWATIESNTGNKVVYSTERVPEGSTGVWVTPIYQFNPDLGLSETNLGTPVGKGVFVPVN